MPRALSPAKASCPDGLSAGLFRKQQNAGLRRRNAGLRRRNAGLRRQNAGLRRRNAGLTLIELLVSIGIISMLTMLILSGVQNVRERAKIQYCQNNLREIGMGLDHYTSLWNGALLPTTGLDDDNLRPLFPDCVDKLEVFVCIETGNQVISVEDLEDNAPGGRFGSRGHSYEYLSYYLYDKDGNELETPIIKSRANVDVRADKVWLVTDAMEAGRPRYPDTADNHWETGGNVLFADSHVEWIERGRWGFELQSGNSK